MRRSVAQAPLVDRIVAPLGARRMVAARPGLGWMLIEFFPVLVWSTITGGIGMEGLFYLTGFLLVLGANAEELSWLMVLHGGAIALQASVMLAAGTRLGMGDPRRFCVRATWIGRSFWWAALAWPFVALALDCSRGVVLGGVAIGIFLGQFFHFFGVSAWATWTQDLVPKSERGPFMAWRYLSGFIAVALANWLISRWWPATAPGQQAPVAAYGWLFLLVSIPCLISTFWLAAAPSASAATQAAAEHRLPLRRAIRGKGAFWRFAIWNAVHAIALGTANTHLPQLQRAAAVDEKLFAAIETWARIPLTVLAVLAGSWLLRRCGSRTLLLATSAALCLGLVAHLQLDPGNRSWLFPLASALQGIGVGLVSIVWVVRLYEVTPRGDVRFPAMLLGSGACALAMVSLLVTQLDGAWVSSWWLVAGALGLRLITLPLLLDKRSLEGSTHAA